MELNGKSLGFILNHMNPFLILTACLFKSEYLIDLKIKHQMNGLLPERRS
jgi:hypothetical protein